MDLLISPIANSAFFVRIAGAAYVVAVPVDGSRGAHLRTTGTTWISLEGISTS